MTLARWALLAIALALAILLGLSVGSVAIPWRQVVAVLAGGGSAESSAIILTLRSPRVALAIVVGAGLAMSGAALQRTLRNPLAEPYLLGVSGGAAVGAVVATVAGLAAPMLIPLAAFAGAILAVLAVLGVARAVGGRADPRVLLMAGVVIGAFANAAILVALARAPESTVRGALWWMMGSLSDARWSIVAWVTLYVAVGGLLLIWWARDLDALSLGEEPAAALGLDVERITRRVYLTASLLAAATVSGAGLIGFVGLVVPAIAQALGARGSRATIIGSALVGAILLVVADVAARTVFAPAELPLGAVTALLGVPFFLLRLRVLR